MKLFVFMNKTGSIIPPGICLFLLLFFAGCEGHVKNGNRETPTSGTMRISVDESFKPVIESEIKVFESSFPDVHLDVEYKPEAACFRDLTTDSTRMVIVTRGLNKMEEAFYQDSFHFVPMYGILAYDAIAVVLNNKVNDIGFSMSDIRSIVDGSNPKWNVVMDGVSATSTVRYVIDSVLRGKPMGKNVMAARSSEEVINYVASHEDAMGFIGVSWIGDQEDPQQLAFLQKVKVAALECANCPEPAFVQPFQANIATKRYPLIRGLYYILKEDFKGVGNNFVNFLQLERGQLIFRRAYLVPAKMSFEIRNMQIRN